MRLIVTPTIANKPNNKSSTIEKLIVIILNLNLVEKLILYSGTGCEYNTSFINTQNSLQNLFYKP